MLDSRALFTFFWKIIPTVSFPPRNDYGVNSSGNPEDNLDNVNNFLYLRQFKYNFILDSRLNRE